MKIIHFKLSEMSPQEIGQLFTALYVSGHTLEQRKLFMSEFFEELSDSYQDYVVSSLPVFVRQGLELWVMESRLEFYQNFFQTLSNNPTDLEVEGILEEFVKEKYTDENGVVLDISKNQLIINFYKIQS